MFLILFVVLVFVLMIIGFGSIASSQTRSPARSSYNDDPEAYLNIDKGIHQPIVNPDDTFEGLYQNTGIPGTYVSYMDTPMPTTMDDSPEMSRLYDDSFSSFDYDNFDNDRL